MAATVRNEGLHARMQRHVSHSEGQFEFQVRQPTSLSQNFGLVAVVAAAEDSEFVWRIHG